MLEQQLGDVQVDLQSQERLAKELSSQVRIRAAVPPNNHVLIRFREQQQTNRRMQDRISALSL